MAEYLPALPAGNVDLASTDPVAGGVDDGAVAAAGAAAHYNPDVLGVPGAVANQLVVAGFLRALGHAHAD